MVRPEQLTIFLILDPAAVGMLAFFVLVVLAILFAARAPAWVHLAVGVAVLAGLFIPIGVLFAENPSDAPLEYVKAAIYFLLLAALFVAGDLFHQGIQSATSRPAGGPWRPAMAFLVGLAIFARLLYNIYWLIVWDGTYDPLGVLWMFLPVVCAVVAGLALVVRLQAQWKYAGLAYLLVGSACLIGVFLLAQRANFRELTDQRAQRVVQALQDFYQRTGSYPATLDQLPWWQRLTLPGPIIFYGQDWCYRGGKDYYRLGYLDREHWSSPIRFGRVVSAQGNDPNTADVCQAASFTGWDQPPGLDLMLKVSGPPPPTPNLRN